jgi:hypothetical protein
VQGRDNLVCVNMVFGSVILRSPPERLQLFKARHWNVNAYLKVVKGKEKRKEKAEQEKGKKFSTIFFSSLLPHHHNHNHNHNHQKKRRFRSA